MTDKDFLLAVLADGRPHSLQEILRWSFEERGHGLTVHSRASDLRRDGYNIEVAAGTRGGVYRLALESGAGEGAASSSSHGGEGPAPVSNALAEGVSGDKGFYRASPRPSPSASASVVQPDPTAPGSPADSAAADPMSDADALQLSIEVAA